MKKAVLFALLAASSVGTWAADYLTASYGLSRLSACSTGTDCDGLGRSFKFAAGTDAPERLRAYGLSSLEVSFSKMGSATQRYTAPLPVQSQDNIDAGTLVNGQYTEDRQANSLGISLVSRHQLTARLNFSARFGVSYTTSTRTTHLGVAYEDAALVLQPFQGRVKEVSASKLAPQIGASLDYVVQPGTKLLGAVEMTRFSVSGDSAPYWQFHLGVMQDL